MNWDCLHMIILMVHKIEKLAAAAVMTRAEAIADDGDDDSKIFINEIFLALLEMCIQNLSQSIVRMMVSLSPFFAEWRTVSFAYYKNIVI